ncbi:unnamed protein product [Soboliphyme baturini]|uniref:Uncharacterized protein n=1 Tax=Soboliphyme baturini TaxID=241478 RepID=A0A183IS56_9BILA|nr:unnamed protein product [Soboliphyme baturini]
MGHRSTVSRSGTGFELFRRQERKRDERLNGQRRRCDLPSAPAASADHWSPPFPTVLLSQTTDRPGDRPGDRPAISAKDSSGVQPA